MEPLIRADEAGPEHLTRQVAAYLAASGVPADRRDAVATGVVASLPEGLDGPNLWQAIQYQVDRALARDEGLVAANDRRLLARARLGYVLGPDGAHLTLPEARPEMNQPLTEDDRFSVPRPVRRQMKQQRLAFWRLATSGRALKRKLRLGASVKREA
jgi:hypothetical protein